MKTYETSATVEETGQIRLTGVPFAAGTEVSVVIRDAAETNADAPEVNLEAARTRMKELFTRLRGRNTEPVGPLRREELYDRKVLR